MPTPWIRPAQIKAQKYLPPLTIASRLEIRLLTSMSRAVAVTSYADLENPKQVRAAHAARHNNEHQDQDLTADGTYVICNAHCRILIMQGWSSFTSSSGPGRSVQHWPTIKHLQLPSKVKSFEARVSAFACCHTFSKNVTKQLSQN